MVARRAHNPKVVGSNPAPATKEDVGKGLCESTGPSAFPKRLFRFYGATPDEVGGYGTIKTCIGA